MLLSHVPTELAYTPHPVGTIKVFATEVLQVSAEVAALQPEDVKMAQDGECTNFGLSLPKEKQAAPRKVCCYHQQAFEWPCAQRHLYGCPSRLKAKCVGIDS